MTLTLSDHDYAATPRSITSVVGAVLRRLSARRARRAQRLALTTLLGMDPARLDDLGISHLDVAEALRAGSGGSLLSARREARARRGR